MRNDLLHIYLADHLAAAGGGVELAKRCLKNNRDSDLGAYLADSFIPEITEDKQTLRRIADAVGAPQRKWKEGAAWGAEKVGRLKLNGRVTGYSPLSRLVELEGLAVGVEAKHCLWASLKAVTDARSQLRSFDLDALLGRARLQRDALERHRLGAATIALTTVA